jgi:GH18 family chitinase
MNKEGPYGCYFYDPITAQNSNDPIWQNFGFRAWQNIKLANDFAQKSASTHQVIIQDWVPNWRNTTFSPINDLDLAADQFYYAFESMTADGIVNSTDKWTDFVFQPDGSMGRGLVASLLALNKPLYIGIGGWNNANEFSLVISNNKINNIVSSTMDLINALNNDAANMGVTQKITGINIDWEPNNGLWTINNGSKYVVTKSDLQNLLNLIDLFKQRNLQVNISIPQNLNVYLSVDTTWGGTGNNSFWNTLAQKTQTLNVMSYDYHAATWDGLDNQTGYTNFNSPLHNSLNQKMDESGVFTNYNIDSTLNYLINNDNISSRKLVFGVPAYGYAFPVNANNYGAYIPFLNDSTAIAAITGLEVANSSLISYKAIYYNMLGGWNHQPYPVNFNVHDSNFLAIDPDAMEAYTLGATDKGFNIWTSFENSTTAAAKAKYAKDKNLGGVMVWEVDQDLPAPISNLKKPNPDSIISGLVNGQ